MVDFGKSYERIKISGKVIKSNTYNLLSSNISFFIQGRSSSDKKKNSLFYILAIQETKKVVEKVKKLLKESF